MAQEIKELLVKITPEGVDETTEGLERQGEQFEETADVAGDSAGMLEGFAAKWQGAMAAIIGGLAVATAGLLSKVPVVGESMALLEGIITAVALQLDEALRPSMDRFNRQLAEVQQDTLEAEGPWESMATAIDGVQEAVDELLARNITGLIEDLTGLQVDDRTVEFAIQLSTFRFWDAWATFKARFGGESLAPQMDDIMLGILESFLDGTVDLLAAHDKFRARFRTAWEVLWDLTVNATKRAANQVIGVVENMANRMVQAIPKLIRDKLGISKVSIPRFNVDSPNDIASAGARRLGQRDRRIDRRTARRKDQVDRLIAAMESTEVTSVLQLDARTVSRVTEPYMGTGAANQGRVIRGR